MPLKTYAMYIKALVLIALVMVIPTNSSTFAEKLEQTPSLAKEDFRQPHNIIDLYLKAVSNGELMIHGQKLDQTMITPIRVDYKYELKNPILIVQVYSELVQPLAVPNMKDCYIHGLSSIIDTDGHITETRAHIWVEPEKEGIGI
jgi:hypothetical protein